MIQRVQPPTAIKRVLPKPAGHGMTRISSDPLVFHSEASGKYYLSKFGQLFECFKSGYVKDGAAKAGFDVTYGKVSSKITEEEKREADKIVIKKMVDIFGDRYIGYQNDPSVKEI